MLLRLKMNRTLSKTMMSHLVTVGLCQEFDHGRQVSVPRAKRARRTPRVAMGQPGFCDYDLVLDLPSDEHDI